MTLIVNLSNVKPCYQIEKHLILSFNNNSKLINIQFIIEPCIMESDYKLPVVQVLQATYKKT